MYCLLKTFLYLFCSSKQNFEVVCYYPSKDRHRRFIQSPIVSKWCKWDADPSNGAAGSIILTASPFFLSGNLVHVKWWVSVQSVSTINISVTFAVLLVISCDLEIIKLNDNDAASTATTTKNNKVCYYLFTLYQALCYAFYLYFLILLLVSGIV